MACELAVMVVPPTGPPESHTSVRVSAPVWVCARRSVAGEVDGAAMSVAWTYQSPACATCSTSEDALTVAAARASGVAPTLPALAYEVAPMPVTPRQTTAMTVLALVQVPEASAPEAAIRYPMVALPYELVPPASARTLVHPAGTVGCTDPEEEKVVSATTRRKSPA